MGSNNKSFITTLKNYYRLTKPGIIYGNILTTAAGFFLASKGHISLSIFIAVMFGTGCIIGSACVLNNYMDRNIDKKMERTKKRPSVTGEIHITNAMIFAVILGLIGAFILFRFTNLLTLIVGVIGFIDYVILYGISKRTSIYGTLVGSISGSMPIVAGYTAVANRFDMAAFLLFLILTLWQMPHFYAIAIYRMKDYAHAEIPVLPVKKGIFETKIHMAVYTLFFLISIVLLTVSHYAGYVYAIIMGGLSLWWFLFSLRGFQHTDTLKWSRKMFFFSLIIITVLSVILPLDTIIRNGILFVW